MATGSELIYNTNATAVEMAQTIFGSGVTVVSATYSGDSRSSAIYSGGDTISPFATPSDTGVILSTGQVASFTQSDGDPNRSTATGTNTTGESNNTVFNAAAGAATNDAAYLDVSFIPTGSVMTIQFVFASEEFPEYATGTFQDFVGVWVNGTQVDMAIGDGDIDPNNLINPVNQNLYYNNTNDAYNTEMDGFTATLTLQMNVVPNQVNTIRIGIADVGDSSYDSNILIAANSAQTSLVAMADTTTMFVSGSRTIDALDNDTYSGAGTLTITHINDIPVTAGSTITMPSGTVVTLNADGTFTVQGSATAKTTNFTYTVSDGLGATDVGYVSVETIPCFTKGTKILTDQGNKLIENLEVGDLVQTLDNGMQPIRWIGQRTVAATGDFAPIRIEKNALGKHETLLVSPQHRVLISDRMAEILYGETEVLVASKDLINDQTVRRQQGGDVTYFHVLFDEHQIVFSNGLATESFHPGPQTRKMFDKQTLKEIQRLFPQFDIMTGSGYSAAARLSLKKFEAEVLLSKYLQ